MENRKIKITKRTFLSEWWQRMKTAVLTDSSQSDLNEHSSKKDKLKQQTEKKINLMYCRHNKMHIAFSNRLKKYLGKGNNLGTGFCCPICGLPAKGNPEIEFVLSVHFIDNENYEYVFRNRSEFECYEVTASTLKIFLKNSIVQYPLHVIGTIEFGIREVRPDSPEVHEAERIIYASQKPKN